MALPTSTFTSYSQIGKREDLSDVIYNVDPTDCPFMTSIPRTKADNTLHEWQTDALDAASSSNAVLEGDDATTDSVTATVRLSNTCQISDKVPRVTGTAQAIQTAGRRDELAYQVVKSTLALRRDMETIVLENQAEDTGNATEPRNLGSINSWYETNSDRGSGGSDGGSGNTAATNGTQRAFTEAQLKGVIRSIWDNGGDPDCIFLGSFNKQIFSGFTGNATRYIGAEDKQLVTSIEVYRSDFGDIEVKPNRFQRARDGHVLQLDMWAMAYLRSPRITNLAKTGDSERRQVLAEYTLESRNEKASGIVADLTTS